MPEWSPGFPYFLQCKSGFCNKELMIWATVSSRFYFCWLYRASPFLAAKNIINLIWVLTIWWCPHVELFLVSSGFWHKKCLLWSTESQNKLLREHVPLFNACPVLGASRDQGIREDRLTCGGNKAVVTNRLFWNLVRHKGICMDITWKQVSIMLLSMISCVVQSK